MLLGSALSLLQMLNVHFAHYFIVHLFILFFKKQIRMQSQTSKSKATLYVFFCLKLSALVLIFGKSENELLLLCLDSIPKTCTMDQMNNS